MCLNDISDIETSLVSIIMPCYNASAFIKESIDSVLAQTHQNFELLIINDGSTDNSEAIIKEYIDKRIRYFYQSNKGQCVASNVGIAEAKGSFIKFLDADDVINKEHLQEQLKRLVGNENSIASCAWGRFYNEDSSTAKYEPESVWKDMKPIDWLKSSLTQKSDMMGAWLWLIPTKILKKAGGWNEKLSLNNDFEFSIRLILHADKILFIENAKLAYRTINNSLSTQKSENAFEAALLSTQLGCSYLLLKDDSMEMKKLCANRYQDWIYRIYPQYPSLIKKYHYEIGKLVKPNTKMQGGKLFILLRNLVGWKVARLLQLKMYRMGYLRLWLKKRK
jgi:glycosyltransferase involved in cell wall biosynthesis